MISIRDVAYFNIYQEFSVPRQQIKLTSQCIKRVHTQKKNVKHSDSMQSPSIKIRLSNNIQVTVSSLTAIHDFWNSMKPCDSINHTRNSVCITIGKLSPYLILQLNPLKGNLTLHDISFLLFSLYKIKSKELALLASETVNK